MRIALLTLLVRDYDEAIGFYTGRLGWSLVEDTPRGGGKRWVRVAPRVGGGGGDTGAGADGEAATGFLLAKATTAEQIAAVGRQTGGRVAGFLETADFGRDHGRMVAAGVRFIEEPRQEEYGTVAVFEDLYGNRFDLIERRGAGG